MRRVISAKVKARRALRRARREAGATVLWLRARAWQPGPAILDPDLMMLTGLPGVVTTCSRNYRPSKGAPRSLEEMQENPLFYGLGLRLAQRARTLP
jgi:hypothetical protein